MRRSGRLFIVLGVLLAIVAFGGIWLIMNKNQAPPDIQSEVPTVPVVVAAVDIPGRTRITPEQLTVKEMPINLAPPLSVTDIVSATDRIALSDIYGDQIILESMLADPEADSNLIPSLSVPIGMVAIAVPLNEISGVAEALRVGDFVDVIVSLNTMEFDQVGNESIPEYSAQFTIQDVEILHLGSWSTPLPDQGNQPASSGGVLGGGSKAPGTTAADLVNMAVLLVEPQDALVLKYAMDSREAEGREAFTFVLRGVEDHDQYTTEAVNQEYMIQRFKFSRPPYVIMKECGPECNQ